MNKRQIKDLSNQIMAEFLCSRLEEEKDFDNYARISTSWNCLSVESRNFVLEGIEKAIEKAINK